MDAHQNVFPPYGYHALLSDSICMATTRADYSSQENAIPPVSNVSMHIPKIQLGKETILIKLSTGK